MSNMGLVCTENELRDLWTDFFMMYYGCSYEKAHAYSKVDLSTVETITEEIKYIEGILNILLREKDLRETLMSGFLKNYHWLVYLKEKYESGDT